MHDVLNLIVIRFNNMQTDCLHYRGLILLNAVDGNSPYPENITLYVITPGQKVNFTVPTLQIVTGYDPVPGRIYSISEKCLQQNFKIALLVNKVPLD